LEKTFSARIPFPDSAWFPFALPIPSEILLAPEDFLNNLSRSFYVKKDLQNQPIGVLLFWKNRGLGGGQVGDADLEVPLRINL
jgi:hypothetical protein